MKYNISKELFEAVMGVSCYQYNPTKINLINWSIENGKRLDRSIIQEYHQITHNDFFFQCKEWALEQGYQLRSWLSYCACLKISGCCYVNQEDFESNSEHQAVFDACEYIRKELLK